MGRANRDLVATHNDAFTHAVDLVRTIASSGRAGRRPTELAELRRLSELQGIWERRAYNRQKEHLGWCAQIVPPPAREKLVTATLG